MNLTINTGAARMTVNGHPFKAHFSDANTYHRIMSAIGEIRSVQDELSKNGTMDTLDKLVKADAAVKRILGKCFPGNDFDVIFDRVNIVTPGPDGKCIAAEFFREIFPYAVSGMREMVLADKAAIEKYAAEYV